MVSCIDLRRSRDERRRQRRPSEPATGRSATRVAPDQSSLEEHNLRKRKPGPGMNVLLSLQRTPSEEQQQATIDKKSEEVKLIQPQEIRSADATSAIILLSLRSFGFKPYNQSNISTTFWSRSYFSIPSIGITIYRLTPLLIIYFAQIAISILCNSTGIAPLVAGLRGFFIFSKFVMWNSPLPLTTKR